LKTLSIYKKRLPDFQKIYFSRFSVKWFRHPKFAHFRLLLGFAIVNVAFVAGDTMTDIVTAWSLFSNDYFWGIASTIPIFGPFLARILISVTNIDTYRVNPWKEIKQILWYFPMMIPLR
jgi:hypothetical protein